MTRLPAMGRAPLRKPRHTAPSSMIKVRGRGAVMNDSGDSNVTRHETIDERLLNRVIFFTDAVFAIVMTLMILDLKPPEFSSPFGNGQAWGSMASHFFAL